MGSDSVETRNRILRAARRVINERGYPAATFQAIAVEADLSRPTLHYYFSSREEIYEALVVESREVMSACIARAGRPGSLAEALTALVGALVEADRADHSQVAFLISSRLEASRNSALGYERGGALPTYVADLVCDAVARGELPADTDAAPIVDLMHSILWGMGLCAGFARTGGVELSAVTAALARVLSHGLVGAGGVDAARDTSRDTPSGVGGRS